MNSQIVGRARGQTGAAASAFMLLLIGGVGCDGGSRVAERPSPDGATSCMGELSASVVVEIRDAEGRPNASGATVRITGPDASGEADGHAVNPLVIHVFAEDRPGPFQVEVEKPWHRPVILNEVTAESDQCGVTSPARVTVTLDRLPDAPTVRQVVLPSTNYGFRQCGLSAVIPAGLEADDSVSQKLIWRTRDTTGVVGVTRSVPEGGVDAARRTSGYGSVARAEIRVQCEEPTPLKTWVVAMAAADSLVRDSVRVSVF